MPLTLPDWAPLPQIVPSQIAASPGVLQNVDGQAPVEHGLRRGPTVETPVPIRDRFAFGRIAIEERDLDRSRTSFGGSSSEPIEEALGRIIGDDGFNSFKTGVDSVNKTEFAEREKALRSGLAEALAKSTLDVMSIAKENIMQQQRAMAEALKQLEDTAEVRVQSDTAVARMGLANA